MKRKWLVGIGIFFAMIVSMFVGFLINQCMFVSTFVVCEHNGNINTYTIQRGQIVGATTSFKGDIDENPLKNSNILKFDLNGIHKNDDAVAAIREQVKEAGGRIISVSSV